KTGGGPFRATVQETEVDGVLFRDLSPYIEETINHRAWINQALIGSTSSEETMERIISSIRFEVEDLGMLRLDDHIDNFSSLTGLNLDRAGQIIVDRLNREEIDYRGLRGIQVKLTNPHSLSFYHQRNFPFYLSFWIPHHSEATPFEHVDFIAVMLDELCQSSAHRINFAYFFAFILHRYADFIESYAPFSIAKKIEVERCLHVMHAKLQLMDRTEFYPRLQRFLNLLLSCVQHNRHCTLMSCFQPNPYYLLELARTTPEFAIEWRENSAKGKEVIPESTISFNNYGLRDADIASLVLNSLVSAKQLFSGLNCLDLSSNNLSDDSVPLLNTLPAIKDLRLRRNNFRSEVVSLFARPMLESLDLTENPLSESTAVAIRQEKRITIHFTPRLFGNIEKLTSLQWSDAVLESEEASLMTSTLPAVAQG
ncbi:MAG TPA: hypothetical protein VD770_04765, partial [Coxiellaceae bacterium]|nr:hypothetical protein [Coxiellaceae bacterium]